MAANTNETASNTFVYDSCKIEPNTEEYLEEDFLEYSSDNDGQQPNMNSDSNLPDIIESSETEYTELFHCNVCDTQFPSVTEHIKEYHSEQLVFVEMDENAEKSFKDGEKNVIINDDQEDYFINSEQNKSESDTKTNQIIAQQTVKVENAETISNVYLVEQQTSLQKCLNCSELFQSKKLLKNHICGKSPSISGDAPIKLKTTKSKRSENMNIERTFVCNFCKTIFQSSKSLKLHVRMHNPVKQKTMEETVDQDFADTPSTDDKNIKPKETFYCEICDKNYDMVFKEIHTQTHNGKVTLICKTCNKKFASEELLILHLNAHQDRAVPSRSMKKNKTSRTYPCSHCGKEFHRPHEKVKHERVHTGEKPHKCEICGKTFRVAYCLTLHMRTHNDARPYVCAVCSKRFKSQSVYNHHLLTHSDARPYQCPYCPKAFKTSVQLAGHKNSHTKPFSCPECNRPFATLFAVKGHIESHKRTNHNLKHICLICGAVYARGFALKDHKKEQHPNVDENDVEPDFEVANDRTMNPKTETQIAEQSIIEDDVEDDNVEIYSEIEQFATEEVITDWLK